MKILTIKRAEWIVAILLTVVVLFLLLARARHAGALWRDECAVVQLATMPTLADLFKNFQRESFPALFPLVVRTYTALFGTTDGAFRYFGLAVGLMFLAVAWFNSRLLFGSPPLLVPALFGLNVSFLTFGSSIRGYGIGSVLILLAFGLVAKMLLEPSRSRIAAALVACVASVQFLLYNSVLLLAVGIAIIAACLIRRERRAALAMAAIGTACALSVLPYVRPFWTESKSTVVLQGPVDLSWFWSHLELTFGTPLHVMTGAWITLFLSAIAGAFIRLWFTSSNKPRHERDLLLFGIVASLLGVVCYLVFLKILSYNTREWYYLALLAFLAGAIDLLIGSLGSFKWVRAARLAFAIAALIGFSWAAWPKVIQRQSNMDVLAQRLKQVAQPRDLIVVNPWFLGLSFNWYYGGTTPWLTCPVLEDHKLHRFDLLKMRMMSSTPIDDLLEVIGATLRSNNYVWLVGTLEVPPSDREAVSLPPAPTTDFGWSIDAYAESWSQQLGAFLQRHASGARFVRVPVEGPVSPLENVSLLVAHGWRE